MAKQQAGQIRRFIVNRLPLLRLRPRPIKPAALPLQVDVFNPATQRTYCFPCNQWLEKTGAGLEGCRKELVAGSIGDENSCRRVGRARVNARALCRQQPLSPFVFPWGR